MGRKPSERTPFRLWDKPQRNGALLANARSMFDRPHPEAANQGSEARSINGTGAGSIVLDGVRSLPNCTGVAINTMINQSTSLDLSWDRDSEVEDLKVTGRVEPDENTRTNFI